MTDLQKVTRAGPTQAGGRFYASASRKDRQYESSFFEALENERKISRERNDESRSKVRDEKEEDKPRELASNDPSLLAGAYQAAPITQTDQPPANDEPHGVDETQTAGPVDGSTAGTQNSTGPAAQAKTTSAQAPANSAQEADAAPAAAAGDQAAEAQAIPTAQADEFDLAALPNPAVQAQPADPATVAQRLANELKADGAAQTPKAAAQAPAAKNGAGESKAGNEQQPGQEQAKAAPPTPNVVTQTGVEGTKAPASQVFEPARLAEAQNKDAVWQICQNIESMVKNRQPALRLVLYPEELGRIDLRLTTSSAGLGVTVTAEQAATNKLLESQMAQLRQALNDAGIQLSHFSVGQQQSQSNSGNSKLPSHGSRSGRSFKNTAVESRSEAIASGRSGTSEIVDYKI